jgi:ring-1,2-phenylacetyl-CoA epoxidase subunit PaaC
MSGHSVDGVYEALTEANDARWAFGTGFSDPLSGMDTTIPSGVDSDDLAAYCMMLADDALIASHRLQEWCTHAPELEDEVALANIGLDLLGQARLLLARAAKADPRLGGEDALAFQRSAHEFRNVLLVEQPNGDFAECVARLAVFATWRLGLLQRLRQSRDPVLAAVAAKGVNEVTYHRDYAARWMLRLGDGTPLSHQRMQAAMVTVWPMVAELLAPHEVERRLSAAGIAVDPTTLRAEFDEVLDEVLTRATLTRPTAAKDDGAPTGRAGRHGEALGDILVELQSVPRANPGATW